MTPSPPVIGISLGDPSGVGPEVTVKALGHRAVRAALVPVVFGDAGTFEAHPLLRRFERCRPESLPARITGPVACEVGRLKAAERRLGRPSLAGGRAQLAYVQAAIAAAQAGQLEGLCTAPVSKEQISRAGVPFMGHTELLASAFGREVLMLMDGPRIKVALATNHVPLRDVSGHLTVATLVAQLELLAQTLTPLLGRAPRIAVCGLNPHAGEGGLLGREEVEVIGPAVQEARRRGVRCTGPHPADGLFAHPGSMTHDVALVMFHDQGLIVAKALDFERTVNVTLGLPLPRTSPDHGTAYRLAGKGLASAVPMTSALLKAASMAVAGRGRRTRVTRARRAPPGAPGTSCS